MVVLPRKKWNRQPQYFAGIDRSNALGKTVTHCIPFNGLNKEVITGTSLVLGSAGSIKADQDGLVLQSTGAAAAASVAIDLSAYTKLTLCFSLLWDAFADNDSLAIEYGDNFVPNSGFLIDPNSGAPFSGEFQIGVGSPGLANAASFSRPQAGKMLRYAIHFDRTTGVSNGCSAYINGIAQSMTPYASNNDVVDNFGNGLLYFFSRAGTSLFGAGRLQNLVIHGGVLLSSKRIAEDYENPWQIFLGQSRPIFIGGGVSSTLAASGAAQSTGTATPSVSYSLSAIGVSASGGNAAAQVAYDLAAAHVSVTTGAAQPTVTATLGASALVQSAGLAGIRPDVLVAAAGSALANGNATLALQALQAAAGAATINGNATMAALINQAAAGVITTEGITALQAAIAALASGASNVTGSATLSGGPEGSINASGGSTTVGAANLDITITLNAPGTTATTGNVDPISLTVALTSAGLIQAVGAGFLVISAPLEAFGAVATGGAASIVNGNVIVVIPAARRFGSRVVGSRPAALQARRRPSAH